MLVDKPVAHNEKQGVIVLLALLHFDLFLDVSAPVIGCWLINRSLTTRNRALWYS